MEEACWKKPFRRNRRVDFLLATSSDGLPCWNCRGFWRLYFCIEDAAPRSGRYRSFLDSSRGGRRKFCDGGSHSLGNWKTLIFLSQANCVPDCLYEYRKIKTNLKVPRERKRCATLAKMEKNTPNGKVFKNYISRLPWSTYLYQDMTRKNGPPLRLVLPHRYGAQLLHTMPAHLFIRTHTSKIVVTSGTAWLLSNENQ